MSDTRLLISDSMGQYIPITFVKNFEMKDWRVNQERVDEILKGPDNDFYWEVWSEVLDRAEFKDSDGHVWGLYQDGDLFAYRTDVPNAGEQFN